jgi:hypothetical protein
MNTDDADDGHDGGEPPMDADERRFEGEGRAGAGRVFWVWALSSGMWNGYTDGRSGPVSRLE